MGATRPAAARRQPAITGSSQIMLLRPTAPCWISAPTGKPCDCTTFPGSHAFCLEAGDTYLAWRVMTRFTLLEVSTSGGSARVSCLAL
jgi:hypothetical protein